MQKLCDIARKWLGKNAVRMKKAFNAKQSLTHYRPGDLVLYGSECSQLDITPFLIDFKNIFLVSVFPIVSFKHKDHCIMLHINYKKRPTKVLL